MGVEPSELVVNAMSIDVEDYFHVSVFDGMVPRSQWDRMESRVCRNTERLLELFASRFAARFRPRLGRRALPLSFAGLPTRSMRSPRTATPTADLRPDTGRVPGRVRRAKALLRTPAVEGDWIPRTELFDYAAIAVGARCAPRGGLSCDSSIFRPPRSLWHSGVGT